MEETLSSLKMADIDLLNNLEKISSLIPNMVLKIEGYTLKENHKEQLEIIILKDCNSSTNFYLNRFRKKVFEFKYILTNCKLYEAPLITSKDNFIRENQNSVFFLNNRNWI